MIRNGPQYHSTPQNPEEIPFSSLGKQAEPFVRQHEQDWDSHTSPSQRSPSRSVYTLLREWKYEIATWLLGSCALGCIVALLVVYRDRPLKEWTSRFLPAPVIAALSQIVQSALLFSISACIGQLKWDWLRQTRSASDLGKFEEASRGPQGSLMLLFKTKAHLVSVGALATILLLGFSSATQLTNSISIRNVQKPDNLSNATITRSVQYMNRTWNTTLVDLDRKGAFNTSKGGVSDFHPQMYKAILSGLLDHDKSISDIQGSCTAEACKWQDYTTLAICASVEEVKGEIRIDNSTRWGSIPYLKISGTSWNPPMQLSVGGSVPDSFWMAAPFKDSANITDGHLPPVSDIYTAYFPACNAEKKQPTPAEWSERLREAANWKALKGSLNLCLQTLSSEYNNTMKTRIIDTKNDLQWAAQDPRDEDTTICLSEPYNGDSFCVGAKDLWRWSSALDRTLEGAAMIAEDYDNYYSGQWVPNIVGDILGPTPATCDPNLESNYGVEGFKRRIDNIAIAMSNALRAGNTTSPLSIVRGSEWNSEQYIAVDFNWIIPPGAIYLAITMFLFATIFKSKNMEVPLWKTSPMVLLHTTERNNGMQTLKQVDQESHHTKVKLQYTGENWHLQEVTGSRI
ncbi:hypothetical protein HBI56_120650 [Parastagonospora nodorum]|uniref:DUF3176 domain containing protein n=2 Tax=Phaeosphaeria nodorum (strain SN15 / ATCC MYA-4574 / FGSC 10173) TaxID=321614 RepID=A0A7U2I7D5_PHANO|nr:hypothetical protein HBH56_054070 [Parastagonospora nodorum]QRD02298.1 hypothetical protein JI435_052740 [Parastagonospora nodorum SN15]KAH3935495.1 hypothetical protein HBH54_039870 [Parastagonospora nodorum]KAH3948611.1 hypothetical protein HBH53_099400 [Parastagonospora nodorum]KAH3970068.1 hypothetical protein HBH51_120010 [Parastagonospora nodorum]